MPTTPELPWTVDTSILVHATAIDAPVSKQHVAQGLLERLFLSARGSLAGQVLGEYLSVVQRKRTMTPAVAFETVSTWSQAARVLDVSASTYAQAWTLTTRHKYQVWDALIIAICAEHGIKTLYSENAGSLKRPLGVQVVNPFAKLEM